MREFVITTASTAPTSSFAVSLRMGRVVSPTALGSVTICGFRARGGGWCTSATMGWKNACRCSAVRGQEQLAGTYERTARQSNVHRLLVWEQVLQLLRQSVTSSICGGEQQDVIAGREVLGIAQ